MAHFKNVLNIDCDRRLLAEGPDEYHKKQINVKERDRLRRGQTEPG